MLKRLFVLFVALANLMLMCGISCATVSSKAKHSEIIFEGTLTIDANGKSFNINGKQGIQITEPFRIETQDDDPGVLFMLLQEKRYTSMNAPIIIKGANEFTVSGKSVNGVFTIYDDKLISIGGNNSPYRIPAKIGDYYIGIKNGPKEKKEEQRIDANILQYIKITVK